MQAVLSYYVGTVKLMILIAVTVGFEILDAVRICKLVIGPCILFRIQLSHRLSGVRGLMSRVQWADSVGPLGLRLGIRSNP
jgi:hypothetical protein